MKKNRTITYGFKAPLITPDNYLLGAGKVPFKIFKKDGNWKDTLPDAEYQNIRGIETYDCTGFNTLNPIEMLMFWQFGIEVNYSDRWVGIIAGTTEGGNDPHVVAEAIRKHGLIPEGMLPFSDDIQNINEYYSFKGADEEACRKAGKEWLEKYDFKHEWVFTPEMPLEEKINNMKVALKSSPLGLSVYAWAADGNGAYIKLGHDNHWTTLYSIDDFQNVFDSYDPVLKKLAKDFNSSFCKRYYIEEKKIEVQPKKSLWQKIIVFFKNLWQH